MPDRVGRGGGAEEQLAGSRCEPPRVPEPGCPASDGMPASGDPTHARDLGKALRPRRLGGLPTTEQPTDPSRLEGERVADVLERERPAHVGGFEPVCRLTKETAAANPSRARASAERPDSVLEHRGHEPQLGRPFGGLLQELGELHRQYLLRNELARIIRLFVAQLHGRMSEQLECHCDGYAFCRPAAPFAEALRWRRTTRRHRCRKSGMLSFAPGECSTRSAVMVKTRCSPASSAHTCDSRPRIRRPSTSRPARYR